MSQFLMFKKLGFETATYPPFCTMSWNILFFLTASLMDNFSILFFTMHLGNSIMDSPQWNIIFYLRLLLKQIFLHATLSQLEDSYLSFGFGFKFFPNVHDVTCWENVDMSQLDIWTINILEHYCPPLPQTEMDIEFS